MSALSLVDPRFYHLDTALAVLDDDEIMYYPAAFDRPSQRVLAPLYPDAILADEADAGVRPQRRSPTAGTCCCPSRPSTSSTS